MKDNKKYRYKAYILGDAIERKRRSMRKSQEEMAEIIEIDPKQFGELERGNAFPEFETVIRLREKLGMSIDEIIDQMLKE